MDHEADSKRKFEELQQFYATKAAENDGLGQHVFQYEVTREQAASNGHHCPSFGELALMYCKPRFASVRSRREGSLWRLSRAAFRAIVMRRTHADLLKDLKQVQVGAQKRS